MNRFGLILFLMIIVRAGLGQYVQRESVGIEDMVDRLLPVASEELNYDEILENIYSLFQNPIDLNRARREDLAELFFLTERQINDILRHRENFGNFLTLQELQVIPSFSTEDINILLPFVVILPRFSEFKIKDLPRRATEHYLVFRADQTLEKSRGFKEGLYQGNRQRYYTRYRFSRSKDFSLGFISEKDPGEKNFFDYTAFHAQIQNKGKIKNAIIGDYLMQFGQGLIFSAGYVAGKGGEPVYTTRRSNLGARPYNSLIENGSFRGATATYQMDNLEITGMVSYRRKDASITEVNDDGEAYFSSLLTAGMHRTEAEIRNKNAIKESNFGGNILYRLDKLQMGFSVLSTNFDKDFEKRPLAYNFYEFTSKTNFIAGPNLSVLAGNFNIFAEAARSSSGGMGYIVGLVGSLSNQVEIALNHRNYRPDFHTFYGNSFSEASRTINEKGFYSGIRYKLGRRIELVAFYDTFRFPWLKYRIDAPSAGHDYQMRLNYKPNKVYSAYLALKGEDKQINISGSNNTLRELVDTHRKSLVISSDYHPNMNIKYQTKLQLNQFLNDKKSNGFAVIQDVEGRIGRYQLKTRFAYFHTDNYDTRVYAYENDVLYAISFPAYYGEGFRYYLLTKIPVGRRYEFWVRAAQTLMKDRESIGSGYDLLNSGTKTDIRAQLKIKL